MTLDRAGQTSDVNSLKSTFLREVDSYVGVTGKITLNEAGDRINGDYDFWAITANDSGTYQWERVAKHHID